MFSKMKAHEFELGRMPDDFEEEVSTPSKRTALQATTDKVDTSFSI